MGAQSLEKGTQCPEKGTQCPEKGTQCPEKGARPPETIDDALMHLARNLVRLTDFIERHADELSVNEMARLSGVLGLNLARYSRMQRDQAALEEGTAQELEADIEAALRLAGERLGVDLGQQR